MSHTPRQVTISHDIDIDIDIDIDGDGDKASAENGSTRSACSAATAAAHAYPWTRTGPSLSWTSTTAATTSPDGYASSRPRHAGSHRGQLPARGYQSRSTRELSCALWFTLAREVRGMQRGFRVAEQTREATPGEPRVAVSSAA